MSFAKVYTFLKDNWLSLLIILLVAVFAFFVYTSYSDLRSKNESLKVLVDQQQERTLQNLADITRSFQQQAEQQARAQEEYNKKINELDAKYEEHLKQVQNKRRVRQRELVDSPSTIPSAFNEVFGIPERSSR